MTTQDPEYLETLIFNLINNNPVEKLFDDDEQIIDYSINNMKIYTLKQSLPIIMKYYNNQFN